MNVRVFTADDGEPRIQVRLPLGVLQMFVEGRPDGIRPEGFPTHLEVLEAKLEEAEHELDPEAERADDPPDSPPERSSRRSRGPSHDPQSSTPGSDDDQGESPPNEPGPDAPQDQHSEGLVLTPQQCSILREECTLHYQRFIALLAVGDFEGVFRDAQRNLRAFDFMARYADNPRDRTSMERHRPFTLMMRSRAVAGTMLRTGENAAAVLAIRQGIEHIAHYYRATGRAELVEQSSEIRTMQAMINALSPKPRVTQREELQRRLDEAISAENYELAAILRDELKSLHDQAAAGPESPSAPD